jgi:DnaJ family protein B protein 12
MEVNKDEAERCKTIATSALQQGQFDKAVKFLKKSLSLYPLPGVEALLNSTAERARDSNSNDSNNNTSNGGSSGSGSGNGTTNNANTTYARTTNTRSETTSASASNNNPTNPSRTAATPNTTTTTTTAPSRSTSNVSETSGGRSYTQVQVDVVERILKAKDSGRNAHYRVLEVSENCTEADLKKSYRKIALKVHPGTKLRCCSFSMFGYVTMNDDDE